MHDNVVVKRLWELRFLSTGRSQGEIVLTCLMRIFAPPPLIHNSSTQLGHWATLHFAAARAFKS